MVLIDMELPACCEKCRFFHKHTVLNPYSNYELTCSIRAKNLPEWPEYTMKRASDCPLVPKITWHWIKVGKEIEKETYTEFIPYWICPVCETEFDPQFASHIRFCPYCGAEFEPSPRT